MGIDEKYDICIQGIFDGEYYPLTKIAEMNITTEEDIEYFDDFKTLAVSISAKVDFNKKVFRKNVRKVVKAMRSAEVWFPKKNRRLRRKRRREKRFRKENQK